MVLGFFGTLISFILWIPQARAVWRSRKDPHALRAVSISTQLLVVINASIWFIYAYVLKEFWVGAAGFINMPLAFLTIYLLLKARNAPVEDYCPACGYQSKSEHLFFVTSPPGWGTVYPCPQSPKSRLPRGIGVAESNLSELRASLGYGSSDKL